MLAAAADKATVSITCLQLALSGSACCELNVPERPEHLTQRCGAIAAIAGVYFGTLMGMADHLAFTLGAAGYRAYKMIPYGPVPETMAYLLRRAQENSDVLGGCAKEVSMMRSELVRRLGISSLLGFNQDHAAATMKRG